jgi:hypothetical protein
VGSRVEKYPVGVIHIYNPLPCIDARTSPKQKHKKKRLTRKEEGGQELKKKKQTNKNKA